MFPSTFSKPNIFQLFAKYQLSILAISIQNSISLNRGQYKAGRIFKLENSFYRSGRVLNKCGSTDCYHAEKTSTVLGAENLEKNRLNNMTMAVVYYVCFTCRSVLCCQTMQTPETESRSTHV